MSRAFVKETDEAFESLPDRPISAHPNLVTPEGLELIEGALARLRQEPRRRRQRATGHPGPGSIGICGIGFPALHRPSRSRPERIRRGPFWLHGDNRAGRPAPRNLPHRR